MADMVVDLMQQTYLDSVLAPMDDPTLQQHPLTKVGMRVRYVLGKHTAWD
jgi:hypothetical protein